MRVRNSSFISAPSSAARVYDYGNPIETCYVLGAGASAAYDSNLVDQNRPPLGAGFFASEVVKSVLSRPEYRQTRQFLDTIESSGNLPLDVEELLAWLIRRLGELDFASERKEEGAVQAAVACQRVLGQFYYLCFDTFREFSRRHGNLPTNYTRLASRCVRERSGILTLNYDMLLEQSAEMAGISWCHAPLSTNGDLRIAKVHGSANWWCPAGRAVTFRDASSFSTNLFENISNFLFSNKLWAGEVRVASLSEFLNTTLEKLVRSGSDYDVPVLLPPFGREKDYNQYPVYDAVWNQARFFLNGARSVTLIGTSMRDQDTKFLETLIREISREAVVNVVCRGRETVEKTRRALRHFPPERIRHGGRFEDFVLGL
jgi:hypothetical protein